MPSRLVEVPVEGRCTAGRARKPVQSQKADQLRFDLEVGSNRMVVGTAEDRKPALAGMGTVEKAARGLLVREFEIAASRQMPGLDVMDDENGDSKVIPADRGSRRPGLGPVDGTVAAAAVVGG